jgi:hypothetical protein
MNLNEWIEGNDSVDPNLNIEKIKLIDDATKFCLTATLQNIYARKHKKPSNFKNFSLSEQETFIQNTTQPSLFENHYSIDPDYIKYHDNLLNARNDDAFALNALQEMASLDFEYRKANPTPDEYWRSFEKLIKYAGVLYRLYAKVLPAKDYQNIDGQKLQRIDLSMSKLIFDAGQSGVTSIEQMLEYEKVGIRSRGKSAQKAKRKEKMMALFNDLDKKLMDRINKQKAKSVKAGLVRKDWIDKYGEEDSPPNEKTIKRYLKEENLL